MESVVVRDPAIMSGEPTFRGTRVLVRTLFDYLEGGHSLERFLQGFPSVSREMARQALEEAKETLLASRLGPVTKQLEQFLPEMFYTWPSDSGSSSGGQGPV